PEALSRTHTRRKRPRVSAIVREDAESLLATRMNGVPSRATKWPSAARPETARTQSSGTKRVPPAGTEPACTVPSHVSSASASPFPIDHRGLKVPDRIGRRRPVGEVADPAGAVGEQHRGLPLELPRREDPVVAVRDEEHHRPERDAALAGDGGEARRVLDEETGVAVAA